MVLPNPLRVLDSVNPLRAGFDEMFARGVRQHYFPRMDFAEPAGDPGWFGPDSAVWYVHEHAPLIILGLNAAAFIENLHPDFAWMGYDHTRALERDDDGIPTGRLSAEGGAVRRGHSFAFFAGVAYGPTAMAERMAKAVSGMHHRVRGVRPDGRAYDADDPHTLRWAYATVVWGLAEAHERYHARPLKDIDEYYGEFVRVGEALGGTDLPATKAEVMQCLDDERPNMALTPPFASTLNHVDPRHAPLHLRPTLDLFAWTVADLQPRWAQLLIRFPTTSRPERLIRESLVKATLNGLHYGAGPIPDVRDARARAAAPVDADVVPLREAA
ncbi:MAG: DUF2236 domain-containing protein [Solirubrobacteraceae bacterium]|nr:DUF2236 domain-containing protein [Solirubrobacteraceae bacterium]